MSMVPVYDVSLLREDDLWGTAVLPHETCILSLNSVWVILFTNVLRCLT